MFFWNHGSNGNQNTITLASDAKNVADALRAAGFYLLSSYQHGPNWGNQASLDDLVECWRYMRATYRLKPKVFLVGQSMGALSALSVVAQGKIPVCGVAAIQPVTSLASMYASGAGTYAGAIDTAYGCNTGTYAALTSGYDPDLLSAGVFAGCSRWRFYASSSDTVVPKTTNSDAFSSKVTGQSAEAAVVACSGDHGDASHFQPSDVLAFAQRCYEGV